MACIRGDRRMKIEIAKLLKKVLDIVYESMEFPCEIRILYRLDREYAAYDLELKTTYESITGGETIYFEDEEAVLHHIEEVLDK